jgi:hypothetical protein
MIHSACSYPYLQTFWPKPERGISLVGFLLFCSYWFNCLLFISFILLCFFVVNLIRPFYFIGDGDLYKALVTIIVFISGNSLV